MGEYSTSWIPPIRAMIPPVHDNSTTWLFTCTYVRTNTKCPECGNFLELKEENRANSFWHVRGIVDILFNLNGLSMFFVKKMLPIKEH